MQKDKQKDKQKKGYNKEKGSTIEEIFEVVEDLYGKSANDPVAKKILETAQKKWEGAGCYEE